jgi:hypothetical protein
MQRHNEMIFTKVIYMKFIIQMCQIVRNFGLLDASLELQTTINLGRHIISCDNNISDVEEKLK